MSSFGFVGQTYQSRNRSISSDRSINLYPELVEGGHPASQGSKFALVGCPGKTLFATIGSPVRAMWGGNNRLFAVGGSSLYEISSAGSVTNWGAVNGSGPAQIVSNGNQLLVWNGDLAPTAFNTFCFTGVSVVPVITSVGITCINGFFVALRPGGADFAGDPLGLATADQTQLNWSTPFDGKQWDPLDYAVKQGAPDAVQMILGPGSPAGGPEELWLLGKKTTEVWYVTGGTAQNTNIFSPVSGAFVNQGLWAKMSAVSLGNTTYFLGGDDRGVGAVWRMNGYIPERVSTFAVEQFIQSYATAGVDISAATGYAYQQDGHQFYVLNFPGTATWVYDHGLGLWHERYSGASLGALSSDRGGYHAATFNGHFVGDPNSGAVYKLDLGVFTDGGNPIVFSRTAPHLNNERSWVRYDQFRLDFGGPFPLTSPRNYTLDISNDGAFTFPISRSLTIGSGGWSPTRAQWNRLGASRDRVFRVTTTDAQQQSWIDAYLRMSAGSGA